VNARPAVRLVALQHERVGAGGDAAQAVAERRVAGVADGLAVLLDQIAEAGERGVMLDAHSAEAQPARLPAGDQPEVIAHDGPFGPFFLPLVPFLLLPLRLFFLGPLVADSLDRARIGLGGVRCCGRGCRGCLALYRCLERLDFFFELLGSGLVVVGRRCILLTPRHATHENQGQAGRTGGGHTPTRAASAQRGNEHGVVSPDRDLRSA